MIIKAVEDSYACGYPRDAAAVLIIEVEGPSAGLKKQAQRIQPDGARRVFIRHVPVQFLWCRDTAGEWPHAPR